ncbi:hypothetical protein [Cysteiniphilum marinum]|nr:hypothetical protein [Cysteiniphilum marinum]
MLEFKAPLILSLEALDFALRIDTIIRITRLQRNQASTKTKE